MSKLNAKRVSNALPKDKEYLIHDGGGLFFRVRPSGAKSWLFSFSLPSSSRTFRMTIGTLDDVSLKEARGMLPALHRLVAQGIDPRNARAATRTENSQAATMQGLLDNWLEFLKLTSSVTPAWIKQHEGRWNLHLKKSLGNLLARDVTRAHLASALDTMSRKGIKEETRKALTTLNLMLDYGLTRHLIDQNPARVLKPKDFSASMNRPRDRVLSLAELRRLWATLDDSIQIQEGIARTSVMSVITASAIKLLILTGARRGEVAAMCWNELDFKNGTWSLPSEKTKNRQAHVIYLSKLSIELLEELKLLTGHSRFVFDTCFSSQAHIHTDTLTRALRRLRKREKTAPSDLPAPLSDMKPFTIHDLRRSAATAWGEYLKIKPHIIERMLNHQPLNKLMATYQRALYTDEQKSGWLTWGRIVEHQIAREPNNVVPINNAVNA